MDSSESSESNERIEMERADDNRTDVRAILAIFVTLTAMAVHFISGWVPFA